MTADPKVVDRELAEIYGASDRLQGQIRNALDSLHNSVGDRRVYYGRRQAWTLTDLETEERARAGTGVAPWDRDNVTRALAGLDGARVELASMLARRRHLEDAYTGWSRFFLVPDGHIHSSMGCSTCRVTTQFGWLPDLSGDTEADAVAAHGALLCTVCYPTAPVEWTNHYEVQAAERAASRCPGSGKYGTGWRNYQKCPECGETVSMTSTGKFRAHKP